MTDCVQGEQAPRKRKYMSGSLRRRIWLKFDKTCQHCGCKTRLFGNTFSPWDYPPEKPCAVDHIVPLSRCGSDDDSNLQLLCISCNASKRDRFIG